MPRKNRPNQISLRLTGEGEVLSFFTSSKRNHFTSEAKIYEALELHISAVNHSLTVYLTTYPTIAVHVACGDIQFLKSKHDELEQAIQNALESQIRQT